MNLSKLISILSIILSHASFSSGQNPLITKQFTADPAVRIFSGKVYVYSSNDIPYGKGKGYN